MLPYVPRRLQEVTLGVQRVAVILPVEEQENVGGLTVTSEPDVDEGQDVVGRNATDDAEERDLVPTSGSLKQGLVVGDKTQGLGAVVSME